MALLRTLREADDGNLSARLRAVSAAVAATYTSEPGASAYVNVVYDDHVIICKGETLWRMPYTVANDGTVVLGDAITKVRVAYVPVTEGVIVGPCAEDGTLEEGAAAQPTGRLWSIIVVQAGMSQNRTLYTREVLQEAAALYEGRPIYADHQEAMRRYGRSTRDVVGFVRDIKPVALGTEGVATFGLAATACITDPGVRQQMLEAYDMGHPSLFEFSHVVECDSRQCRGADGRPYHEVLAIKKVKSVDLVTEAAAGGRALTLVASAVTDHDPVQRHSPKDTPMLERLLEAIKTSGQPALLARLEAFGAMPTDDQILGLYAETVQATREPAPVARGTDRGTAPPVEPGSLVITEAAIVDLKKDALLLFAENTVHGCALPDQVKAHLRARFSTTISEATTLDRLPSKASLTAQVAEQVTLFGQLAEAKIVLPANGRPHLEVTKNRRDQFVEAVDAFFDPTQPMVSFRRLYVDFTGDTNITGRVEEATRLSESLQTTSFAEIFGDSVTRRMLAEYTQAAWNNWRGVVADVVPVSDLRTQRRLRFGGYPNLPIVPQGAPYQALTSPTDEEATYTPAKRGGTEDITREMIINDDVGAIRRIPQRLARAAGQTLHEFVWDALRTNAAIYDTVALAAVGHANLVTTALSADTLTSLRNKIKVQTDMSNGKRLGLSAKHLFVPVDLEALAFQLTTSDRVLGNANNDPNFVKSLRLMVHVIDYWTDANDYWVSADPSQTPMIEVGFLNGREEPELFLQDNPTVGSMFSHDKLTYKIRHEYGGGVMDFRGFAAGIVA